MYGDELRQPDYKVQVQVALPVIYKEIRLEAGYRIDLLIENKAIIEVKVVDVPAPIHMSQALTYLRLQDPKLGLLMNFNTSRMTDGIKRVINGHLG